MFGQLISMARRQVVQFAQLKNEELEEGSGFHSMQHTTVLLKRCEKDLKGIVGEPLQGNSGKMSITKDRDNLTEYRFIYIPARLSGDVKI